MSLDRWIFISPDPSGVFHPGCVFEGGVFFLDNGPPPPPFKKKNGHEILINHYTRANQNLVVMIGNISLQKESFQNTTCTCHHVTSNVSQNNTHTYRN